MFSGETDIYVTIKSPMFSGALRLSYILRPNLQRNLENGIKLRCPGPEFSVIFLQQMEFYLTHKWDYNTLHIKMQTAKPMWKECSGLKCPWNNIILTEMSPRSAVVCSCLSSGFATLSHGLECQWCALWFHYGSVSFQTMEILVTHVLYSSLRTRTVAWEPGDMGFRCSWRNYRLLFWITAKITFKTHSKFTWLHVGQLSLASSYHL